MAWRLVELTTKYRAGETAEADDQARLRALIPGEGMGQTALPETPAAELPPPPPR